MHNDSLFRQLVRRSAAHPAHRSSVLADAHQQCTYPEIPACVDSIQRFLRDNGVQPQECVTVEATNSLSSVLTVIALFDAGQNGFLMPQQGQGARAGSAEIGAPKFSRWVLTPKAGTRDQPTNLAEASDFLHLRVNPEYRGAPLSADGPHIPRLYAKTSGSLGMAKLAVLTHHRWHGNMMRIAERMRFAPSDRIAVPAPIFHMYAIGMALFPGLTSGVSLDFQERGNLLRFLQREAEFNPNIAFVTPTFCEALLRIRKSPRRYSYMISCGDRIADATRTRMEAMHGPLINAYGTTEMGCVATAEPAMSPELRTSTVGRPLPGIEIRFVDNPTAEGATESGKELQLLNPYGFAGYVDADGNELKLPDAFDGEWFKTKDLAAPGPDGTLRVLGRCDLSMNRNGMLLPFADVESRLRTIEGVEEAAVAAGREDIRGRALVAFCVVTPKDRWSSGELRAQCAQSLPTFAVPDSFHILDALPKLPSGKIDRPHLARLAQTVLEQPTV